MRLYIANCPSYALSLHLAVCSARELFSVFDHCVPTLATYKLLLLQNVSFTTIAGLKAQSEQPNHVHCY
jgi:hypothetical protein